MLPSEELCGEVIPLDNLAGVGAIKALLDKKKRDEAAELSNQIRFIELAQEPDFTKKFIESTAFPPLSEKNRNPVWENF
jgi:uncharacterized 2Fe-2S/4Fe-4S cluster protein (DUF4445 family)